MKKRSPTKTAWLSVLIMFIGVAIGFCSLFFLDNKPMAMLVIIIAIAVFVAGKFSFSTLSALRLSPRKNLRSEVSSLRKGFRRINYTGGNCRPLS